MSSCSGPNGDLDLLAASAEQRRLKEARRAELRARALRLRELNPELTQLEIARRLDVGRTMVGKFFKKSNT